DLNRNGKKDPGEQPVEGLLVMVNDDIALTDDRGAVTYYNLEPGNYRPQIVNNTAWKLANPAMAMNLTKNQSLEIPVLKTKILQGKVEIVGKTYLETPPSLSGITISARDAWGNEYTTLTDNSGAFLFYLSPFVYE